MAGQYQNEIVAVVREPGKFTSRVIQESPFGPAEGVGNVPSLAQKRSPRVSHGIKGAGGCGITTAGIAPPGV